LASFSIFGKPVFLFFSRLENLQHPNFELEMGLTSSVFIRFRMLLAQNKGFTHLFTSRTKGFIRNLKQGAVIRKHHFFGFDRRLWQNGSNSA
jgi:hypothetical protein